MSAFLKVSGMEFAYGEVTVLRGLDLEVEEGTISCVMGRNGVGKTTFLRNVVGLEKSSAGNVLMDGTEQILLKWRLMKGLPEELDMFRKVGKSFHFYRLRKTSRSG